jgi:hypothetical protein
MWKKICNIIGKCIIAGFILAILFGGILMIVDICKCISKNHDNELYFNKKGIIVKVGKEEGWTNDKFHTATQLHTILIMDIKDSTSFIEWRTTTEKYYNYKVGDTVHFDHIRRDRWFKITRH